VSPRGRAGVATSLLLVAAGGLALSTAFPPAGLWPVAFVGLVPLLWALRHVGPLRGGLLGLVFGIAFFGATLYWIGLFGAMAWVSLTLLSASFTAGFGALAPTWWRAGRPVGSAAGLASVWVLIEHVRGVWPLGGFSWGTLGVSQVDDRVLLPLASILGAAGLSFVVVAVNVLLVEAIAGGGGVRGAAARVVLAAVLIVAPISIGFPEADGPSLEIATLQVDVREAERPSSVEEDIEVARMHLALHRSLVAEPPDLVVWGEGALDPGAAADPTTAAQVRDTIAAVGAPTVVGAVADDADGRQRTTVFGFDGDGGLVDRYDKVQLVPFGEYVPWRARLAWIEALEQIPVDRAPGERVHPIRLPGVPAFGTPICFENSFALPLTLVRRGATFLIVPVNNASYGTTAASAQHLQMSQIRAVETGRWTVNAAISGVSAFIDPSGRITSRTTLFETGILRGTVRTSDARTPYVRWGGLGPLLWMVIALSSFLAQRRGPNARHAVPPLPDRPAIMVILPTFDEAPTIEQVIRGILARPDQVSVLVVDDSSPDGTAAIVRAIAEREPRVRLRERPSKSGLASAYLEGFSVAIAEGSDLIVEMDSDLSHDPEELARLLDGARRHHLTIGSRYVPGGSVTNWSRLRLALSRGGNLYAGFMLSLPVHDATSGYRVYRRTTLEALLARPIASDGYGFQVELALRAWQLGFDIGEVPITFRERQHGASKISRRIVVEALWLITKWGLASRLERRPVDSQEPPRVDRD